MWVYIVYNNVKTINMAANLGNTAISAVYLGSDSIDAIYIGATQVYP